MEILKTVNKTQCTTGEKQDIGPYLARLLTDETIFRIFVATASSEFFCEETVELFNKWLGDPEIHEFLPPERRIWYDNTVAQSPANVLRPMVEYVASRWTWNDFWDPELCCADVYNFINLQQSRPPCSISTLEQVLEAAEWGDTEKDDVWYHKTGLVLRGLYLDDHAIGYFQKAFEMNPTDWRIRSSMVKAYQQKHRYGRAIDLYHTVIEDLKAMKPNPALYRTIHDEYEKLGLCYWLLDDHAEAFNMWRNGYEFYHCSTCAKDVLLDLTRKGQTGKILELLQTMNGRSTSEGVNCLTDFLITRRSAEHVETYPFGAVILREKCMPFFVQAYTDAIATSRRDKKTVRAAKLELALSVILHRYGDGSAQAARIWERLIETYKINPERGEVNEIIREASARLSAYYLAQSLRADCSESDKQQYGQLLERLNMARPLLSSNSISSPIPQSSLPASDPSWPEWVMRNILGIYYKTRGRDEDSLKYFKPLIQGCLDRLTGYDMRMDGYYFTQLGKVMAGVGDLKNYTTVKYQSHWLYANSTGSPNKTAFCDGCGKTCAIDGLARCSYCENFVLCGSCLPLLKSGKLRSKICDSNHAFMILSPRPEYVRERTEEHRRMLYHDGVWISLQEFKALLTAQYGL